MIRSAQPKDLAAVEAIVAAAYGIYIDRIGKPPGPMLDDYRELIAAGALAADRAIAALVGAGAVAVERKPHRMGCS